MAAWHAVTPITLISTMKASQRIQGFVIAGGYGRSWPPSGRGAGFVGMTGIWAAARRAQVVTRGLPPRRLQATFRREALSGSAKPMRRLVFLLAPLLLAACAAAPVAGPGGTIVEVSTGAVMTPAELAGRLAAADVAVLGEVHDNADHHARQAWLIEALDPAGVAFEMVPDAREGAVAGLGADAVAEALDWETTGWPDWAIYRPVFVAAEGRRIAGGGVARDELRASMKEGAAAYWTGDGDPGLDEPLDEELRVALEAEMMEAHCNALPAEMMPGMIESQRLRDARFAAAALRAGAGERAVLITGNGHARTDRGVPVYLARLAPEATVLALGQIELAPGVTPEPALAEGAPYDFVWFSGTAEREDPCAVFEKRGKSGG